MDAVKGGVAGGEGKAKGQGASSATSSPSKGFGKQDDQEELMKMEAITPNVTTSLQVWHWVTWPCSMVQDAGCMVGRKGEGPCCSQPAQRPAPNQSTCG